jgi:hypothetical protein
MGEFWVLSEDLSKFWLKSKTVLINAALTALPVILLILDHLQTVDMKLFLSPQGVAIYTIAVNILNIVLRFQTTKALTTTTKV